MLNRDLTKRVYCWRQYYTVVQSAAALHPASLSLAARRFNIRVPSIDARQEVTTANVISSAPKHSYKVETGL